MATSDECIFCKIVSGRAPSFLLAEDRLTYAIMDINPFTPGHALVLAKGHYPDIFSTPAETLGAVAKMAKRIARAVWDTVEPHGMNIVQANGPGAAQSVLHYHVHVLPRYKGDNAKLNWSLAPGDQDQIRALTASIRGRL